MRWIFVFFLLYGLSCPGAFRAGAQVTAHAKNDTIRLGGVIVGPDTLAMVFLEEVTVHDRMPARLARQRARQQEEMDRLRYNVYKVYPYAVTAADVLKDVDVYLAKMSTEKERKQYMKTVEKDLNSHFKGELKDLTITQGQILVKLIDRQTGKNCFSIIKEMKGGFNAFVWQSVALLFSNNLKREYDPYDRDRDIEAIVHDLESRNWYEYQRQQQYRVKNN